MTIPFLWKKFLIRTGVARFLPVARRLTDGGAEYLRYYSDDVLAAPVEDLLDPINFPNSPAPDVLNLNEPAPRFDSPVSAVRSFTADRSGVPPVWGLTELRQNVAELYRRRHGRSLDPQSEVFVTHGATGALASVLDAFVNPGDRVALFSPCSPQFAVGAKSRRARVRWVPTIAENGRLTFDFAALGRAMRGAKLLALADPANPTGCSFDRDDLERIAWLAQRHDVLLYSDESFARFRYEGRPCELATIPQAERRTLSAGSVTQGYGLASIRVGWLAGPKPLVQASALTATLAAPFVPTVCQQIASQTIAVDDDLFAPMLERFRARRRYAFEKLKAQGLQPVWPSGGYFLWASIRAFGMSGREFAERLLTEQRVMVSPGKVFGPGGDGFVRISFAADDGRLREGLGRLAAFVAGLRGEPVVRAETIRTPEERHPAEADAPMAEPERPPAFSRV